MTFDEWWAQQHKDVTAPITPRRAWEAATLLEREACAKKVRALAPPFEQTRHGTMDYERGVLDAVDEIVSRSNGTKLTGAPHSERNESNDN